MRTENYREFFTKDYMMGPNSIRLLDEMLTCVPKEKLRGRMLDLGCGLAITSLFLARETAAETVYATDLWISATDNLRNIKKWDEEKKIIPIHADAMALPYAEQYFDVVVSVDAYHYFGCQEKVFDEKILPLLAPRGCALIAIPGVKSEAVKENPLLQEWAEEDLQCFHSCEWWKRHIEQNTKGISVTAYESQNFDAIWNDWFESGHEYARRDKEYFEKGMGQFLNFSIIVVEKTE